MNGSHSSVQTRYDNCFGHAFTLLFMHRSVGAIGAQAMTIIIFEPSIKATPWAPRGS